MSNVITIVLGIRFDTVTFLPILGRKERRNRGVDSEPKRLNIVVK